MTDFFNNIEKIDDEISSIMVIGVGGGGGNAVKYMYSLGIHDVMFTVCNTDAQALSKSPVPHKLQIGKDLTKGRGAGNKPERGRDAALESSEEIKKMLLESKVEMIFITAGMGGGTGTGAAPIIAEIARELEILSVAIVTTPFLSEGESRISQAKRGIDEIKEHVDALLIIDNENINKMYGDLGFTEAFGKSDDVLATAAKGIAEIITKHLAVNVDFADVKETMSNSGVAIMGFAEAPIGDDNISAILAEEALKSPLLNQNDIRGAKKILVKIAWKDVELKMKEVYNINDHIQAAAGQQASLIWGAGFDDTLKDGHVSVVVIATGFGYDTLNYEEEIINKISSTSFKIEEHTHAEPKNIAKKVIWLDEEDEPKREETQNPQEDGEFQVITRSSNSSEIKATTTLVEEHSSKLEYLSLDDEPEQEETIEESDNDNEIMLEFRDNDPYTTELKAQSESLKQRVSEAYINSESAHTLFSDSDFIAQPVQSSTARNTSSQQQYTDEELEQLPAYIRRKVVIGQNNCGKSKKVIHTIKSDDQE